MSVAVVPSAIRSAATAPSEDDILNPWPGEADGDDHPVQARHGPEQAGLVDGVPVGAQHRPDRPGHQRGQEPADPGLHRVQVPGIPGDRAGHRGHLVQVDAGRHLHGPAVGAGEAIELRVTRAADEDLLLLAGQQLMVGDGKPGQHLGEHRQVGAQRVADRPGAGARGDQDLRRADLLLIGADPPPVSVALQRPDLALAQERGAVPLGLLEGAEHGPLAADEAALGIEHRHVAIADQVLGQALPGLGSRYVLEAEAALAARAQQRGVDGVVVVGDRHHAGDGEQLGPAGRLELAPQVAGPLEEGRVLSALHVDHPEHPGLARVGRERPGDHEPVDADDAQPARGQLPAGHAPDRARPDDHDIRIQDRHRASSTPDFGQPPVP